MRSLLLLIFATAISNTFAEGIDTSTLVTARNSKYLAFHKLEVEYGNPKDGRPSFIRLKIRPSEANPFQTGSVTIYDEDGKKRLFEVKPRVIKNKKGGCYFQFHVAEKLIDRLEIHYTLRSQRAFRGHFFTIKGDQIRKMATN